MRAFISYSHKDEKFRANLETHLSLLKRQGVIESWSDRKITPGQDWSKEIDENLEKASIVFLLVSPDFIASDYCYEKELRRAIEKHDSGQLILIPIIIRHCLWKNSPLASFQALPHEGKPISAWKDKDEAWVNVVTAIKEICQVDRPISIGLKETKKQKLDDTFRIGVMGYSGVGKSSLCNALARREVTRVSDIAPQTRSVYSANLSLGSSKIEIYDCPGLGWALEDDKKFLQTYKDVLSIANMAIWVINAGSRATISEFQFIHDSLRQFILGGKYFILVVNKVDLMEPIHEWDTEHKMPGKSQLFNIERQIMHLSKRLELNRSVFLPVSCKENYNIEQLESLILNNVSRNTVT